MRAIITIPISGELETCRKHGATMGALKLSDKINRYDDRQERIAEDEVRLKYLATHSPRKVLRMINNKLQAPEETCSHERKGIE